MWIFGQVWCRGWLVTDVWISTASILNLCAISIDRYVAVTRPVKYRSIMTNRRAKSIVAIVWILSFIICFPPLLTEWRPSGAAYPPQSSPHSPVRVAVASQYGLDMDTSETGVGGVVVGEHEQTSGRSRVKRQVGSQSQQRRQQEQKRKGKSCASLRKFYIEICTLIFFSFFS